MQKLLKTVLETAGAQSAVLLVKSGDEFTIEAHAGVRPNDTGFNHESSGDTSIHASTFIPWSIIRYTDQTKKHTLLNNAARNHEFINDPYIVQNSPLSLLCLPVVKQSKLVAILYMENNLATGAFTSKRLELLKILCSQAAISLENSLLYKKTNEYSKNLQEREVQLREKTKTLEELNTTLEVLLERVNTQREQVEKHLYFNVNDLVMPSIEKLEASKLSARQQALLATISQNLDRIATPFLKKKSVVELKLTPMEMQVANMIKQGRTGRQISNTLNLSFNTIETHKKTCAKNCSLPVKKCASKNILCQNSR